MAHARTHVKHGASTGIGAQGTLGGTAKKSAGGTKPGMRQLAIGDAGYLWLLVGLEVATIAYLRQAFRRHHGG